MDFINVNWTVLGMVVGAWWGVYSLIHYTPHPLPWKKKHWDPKEKAVVTYPPCCPYGKAKNIARSIVFPIYQFVFNFIGGLAGCIGLGLFFQRFAHHRLGWQELVLLFLALAGVMGKFSEVMYLIPDLLRQIVNTWAEKQKGNEPGRGAV